jgi:hypothetical protein
MVGDHWDNQMLVFKPDGTILDSWGSAWPGGHGLTLSQENGEEFLFLTDSGLWKSGGGGYRPGGGGGYRSYFLGADFNAGSYAVGNIVTLKYNQTTGSGVSPSNGTRTLYVNSSSSGTNATTGWLGNGTGLGFIGRGSFAGAMDGGLYYICMFSTALSDSDRLIVESI